MNNLAKMGIQQWRLKARDDAANAGTAAPEEPGVQLPESEPAGFSSASPQVAVENLDPEKSNHVAAKISEGANGQTVERQSNTGLTTASWDDLAVILRHNGSCASCDQTSPVLGVGTTEADWVFVVDAPSTRDIQSQQLLSGRAGQLFDAMLNAVGMTRDAIYLTSIFKCPPSENVSITAQCGDVVHRQIELLKPKVVLTLGEFAAQTLLRTNDELTTLRGQLHHHPRSHAATIVSYSPAQMLEQPALKAQVWQDLQHCLQQL